MRDPLTGGVGSGGSGSGGDDAASQSSQRSRASLLDRIRAQQRNRDGAGVAGADASIPDRETEANHHSSSTPSTIQVPQYTRLPQESSRDHSMEIPTSSGGPSGSSSGFLSQAWNNISHSMETGMASLHQERSDVEARDALLPPTTDGEENYSMVNYFTTFVRDVYETFLDLPLWVRIIVVFALLYTAWKLI